MFGAGAGTPRIVVLGGGFAGLETAFYLRRRLGRRARLTVIADSSHFLYRPGLADVPFKSDIEPSVFPIAPALARRGIEFVHDRFERLDLGGRAVHVTGREVLYDYLVLATGAVTKTADIPGLGEYGHAMVSPGDMVRLAHALTHVVERASAGLRSRVLFVVPPGNCSSAPLYENALRLDTWLRRHHARAGVDLGFATVEHAFLEPYGPRADAIVAQAFADRDIAAATDRTLVGVEPGRAWFAGRDDESFNLLVTFPELHGAVRYLGLPHDRRGFVHVDPKSFQVIGHPDLYAVGDAADFPLKQAYLAMLEADAAAEDLSCRLLGEARPPGFDPVGVCIIDHFDSAIFAQAPLATTGDPDHPIVVRSGDLDLYRVGTGEVWRAAKRIIGEVVPRRFRMGMPVHAGVSWMLAHTGLRMMTSTFAG